MASDVVTRRKVRLAWSFLTAGLNSVDDIGVKSRFMFRELVNVRPDSYSLTKRYGTTMKTNAVSDQRFSGLHNWLIQNPVDEDGAMYAAVGGKLYRARRLTQAEQLAFPAYELILEEVAADVSWSGTPFVSFESFGGYAFAFNGSEAGVQFRKDNTLSAYGAMLERVNIGSPLTNGAGTITGVYVYKVRAVREGADGERIYWGAKSVACDPITANANAVRVPFTPLTDTQVTHYYIERSESSGTATYYHDSITSAEAAVGYYDDNTAATDTTTVHTDVYPRLLGVKWCCKHKKKMIYYALKDEDSVFYWSSDNKPQEILNELGSQKQGNFIEGHGKSTGCFSIGDYVVLLREHGVGFYRLDANDSLEQVAAIVGVGCYAPWSVCRFNDNGKEYAAFFDDKQGMLLMDESGKIKRITKIRKQLSEYEYAYTDASEELKKIDPAYMRYVSCGYGDGFLHVYYTVRGETRNSTGLRYYVEKESWYGPDTGRSIGKMITRVSGYGPVVGSGELLGCNDGTSSYVAQLNPAKSLDLTTKIPLYAWMNEVGSDDQNYKEFSELYVNAKVSRTVRIDFYTYGRKGNYVHSYFLRNDGAVVYNGSYTFNSGVVFNDTTIPLYDDNKKYNEGVVYGQAAWKKYRIGFGAKAQGLWCRPRIVDTSNNAFSIGDMELIYYQRGTQ